MNSLISSLSLLRIKTIVWTTGVTMPPPLMPIEKLSKIIVLRRGIEPVRSGRGSRRQGVGSASHLSPNKFMSNSQHVLYIYICRLSFQNNNKNNHVRLGRHYGPRQWPKNGTPLESG